MKINTFTFISILTLLLFSTSLFANVKITDTTTVVFATVEQGKALLGKKDDFVSRLSPFDRAARLKTDKPVSTEKYLEFVKSSVLPWTDKDKAQLTKAYEQVGKSLKGYSLPLPKQIMMIKTSGNEEAHAAYTRANAIMFGKSQLAYDEGRMQYLLFHELFHVLSRADSELKHNLYRVIGFHQANDLQFPKSLKEIKLTNPDAPINDHYIQLMHDNKLIKTVPVLFSKSANYDMKKGGEFFNYLSFKLLVVDHDVKSGQMTPVMINGKPVLLSAKDVPDFSKQIGQNTGYIIHPEEILADNFSFLMTKRPELKSPQIVKKIKQILEP